MPSQHKSIFISKRFENEESFKARVVQFRHWLENCRNNNIEQLNLCIVAFFSEFFADLHAQTRRNLESVTMLLRQAEMI